MLKSLAMALVAAGWAVGAWAQVSVSTNGQPSYIQAIPVPPGISGMVPQLSLLYSGGGAVGPVGAGWALQGVSAITRCASDKIIDGSVRPVTYGPTDKLCLDGQRLIATDSAGKPLATGDDASGVSSGYREYRTSKDSYARIRAYEASGANAANGPLYFKVWTKAGRVYEYGQAPSTGLSAKALILAQGKTAVMAWGVARVSDIVGNYIDFQYDARTVPFGSGPLTSPTEGVEWNISTIWYTGKVGEGARSPNSRIIFNYTDAVDSSDRPSSRVETYHAGSKNVSVRRLSWIRSFVGNALVRTTILNYETAPLTGRSRLIQLKECFGESAAIPGEPGPKCTPAVKFSYSTEGGFDLAPKLENFNLANLGMLAPDGSVGVLVADFNGDGLSDIFRWSAVSPDQNQLFYSNGNGSFRQEAGLNFPHLLFTTDACFHSMVVDMNADGLPDIVRFANSAKIDGSICTIVGQNANTLWVFNNDGAGKFTPVQVQSKSLAGVTGNMLLSRKTSMPTSRYVCDGLLSGQPSSSATSTTGNGTDSCTNGYTARGWDAGATFYIFDVNGDGRPDIVTSTLPAQQPISQAEWPENACPAGTICTRVFRQLASGLMEEIATDVSAQTLYSDPGKAADLQYQKHLADIDGDGFLDLSSVGKLSSLGGWRSTDNGNFAKLASSGYCERDIDFNGDGRRDCLYASAGTPTSNALSVSKGYVASGSSLDRVAAFNLTTADHPLLAGTEAVGSRYGLFTMDLNSDGREDIFRWHDDPALNRLYLSNGDGTFRLVSGAPIYSATPFKSSDYRYDVVVADFTGHGVSDMLRLSSQAVEGGTDPAKTNNLYTRVAPGVPDLLKTVTSSTGLVTRLSYGSLINDPQGRYLSDRGTANQADYPMVDVVASWPVVITVEEDSGVGSATVKTEFKYFGMKASLDGSPVFGFRNRRTQTVAANGSDTLTTSTVHLLHRPYEGMVRTTETRVASLDSFDSAPMLSRTAYTYCDTTSTTAPPIVDSAPCPTQATVQRPYLRLSIETGKDLVGIDLPKVTTTYAQDDFGNTTQVERKVAGLFDGVNRSYTKTTDNTFDPANTAGDNWFIGLLTKAKVQSQVANLLIMPSAGTAPNASSTSGVGLP